MGGGGKATDQHNQEKRCNNMKKTPKFEIIERRKVNFLDANNNVKIQEIELKIKLFILR